MVAIYAFGRFDARRQKVGGKAALAAMLRGVQVDEKGRILVGRRLAIGYATVA
jgi:hypothetical protein